MKMEKFSRSASGGLRSKSATLPKSMSVFNIDVLQPIFQGLHYGQETTEELSRRKRRWTAAEKRERAREEQLERLRRDQSTQQRNGVEWERARIDLWR